MRLRRRTGAEDLQGGTQAPQRNAALVNAFDMKIEPGAVVICGQMRKPFRTIRWNALPAVMSGARLSCGAFDQGRRSDRINA